MQKVGKLHVFAKFKVLLNAGLLFSHFCVPLHAKM